MSGCCTNLRFAICSWLWLYVCGAAQTSRERRLLLYRLGSCALSAGGAVCCASPAGQRPAQPSLATKPATLCCTVRARACNHPPPGALSLCVPPLFVAFGRSAVAGWPPGAYYPDDPLNPSPKRTLSFLAGAPRSRSFPAETCCAWHTSAPAHLVGCFNLGLLNLTHLAPDGLLGFALPMSCCHSIRQPQLSTISWLAIAD